MNKRFFVLLIASVVVLLAGCEKKAAAGAAVPAADGATGVKKTLTAVFASEPQTIDPQLNNTVDGAVYLMHAFEGLYKYVDNGVPLGKGVDGAKTVPGLAVGEPTKKVNADGTVVYTYKLRSGLKWSDGSPLTAQDFVYSWQRLVDPKNASPYNYMIDMVVNANDIMARKKAPDTLGIKALDDTTLQITLTYDCPYFGDIAAFPATFPVQKATIDKAGDQWTFSPDTYVCDGPYKMAKWEHNGYLLFEKNPYYYDAANIKGPDQIKWMLMADENAELVSFKSGEIDYMQAPPPDEMASLVASGECQTVPQLGIYYFDYNCKVPPFDNPKVREAFTLAVDRQYIIDQVARGGQAAAGGFVPSGVPDATPGSDFRKTGGNYYDPSSTAVAANVKKAQDLLAEAGYPGGKGFPSVEYLYNTTDGNRAIAEALQNMWETNLGVTVTLSNQDWAVFVQTRRDATYAGMARDGWVADFADPVNFLDLFVTGGGNNNCNYSNADFDAAEAKVHGTAVQADRMKYLHQAEDIAIGRDWAVCPLYFYTVSYMYNPKIKGLFYSPMGFWFFSNASVAK